MTKNCSESAIPRQDETLEQKSDDCAATCTPTLPDSESGLSDSDSEVGCYLHGEEVATMIQNARNDSAVTLKINWWKFCGVDLDLGWKALITLASNEKVFMWYVGIAQSPVERMEGSPSCPRMVPHAKILPHNVSTLCDQLGE